MNKSCTVLSPILLFAILCLMSIQKLEAQRTIPAVLDTASLSDQLDYINERTRVFNDYRAIREDIFQRLRRNIGDSTSTLELNIARLESELRERDNEIETLMSDLERARTERDEAIRNRDSLTFLGIQLGKGLYNTLVWLIIVVLAVATVISLLLFRQGHSITRHTRKELENLQEEYDSYRKNAREKYEKLVVSHHQELMKLKQKRKKKCKTMPRPMRYTGSD